MSHSQAARSTAQQSSRPVLHERQLETDEDATDVGNPAELSIVEAARPWLLFKALVDLNDTTEEWEDRSNRMPSTAAVNTMIESFKTRNVKRRDPSSRIICGIRHADFDALFPNQDTQNPGWLGLWRPRDDATAVYQPLIWGNLPKIQIIAGQHRKLALKIHDPTNFNWVCNVYDLDAIPAPTLIELGGNPTTVAHAATMGEIFRDMAAVAPHLAAQDTLIVQPHLNPRRPPTLNEYLGASRHGDESKLQKTFMNALTVCSQQKSIDKLVVILASPLREELTAFVNSGAGMDLFSIDGMRDMCETQCFHFWNTWLASQNRFFKKIMGQVGIRHFDITLLNKLAGLGSRNESSVATLFWTSTGIPTASSPFSDHFRSKEILPLVSDQEYRRVYDRVKEQSNMSFELMSRNQFQQFKIHNIPALRSSMDQVLRWLVPAGDFVPGATRYAPKRDLRVVLQGDYFQPRNYSNNIVVADNLINLVAQIVFDHLEYFSPKALKGLDNYPTVTIKGKGDKENNISKEDYLTRFKVQFYWFHLAKSVARYVNYDLTQDFMRSFNDPHYHCFNLETTTIAVDLMEGRTSFGHHSEIALNALLAGKEGRILHQQITADIRKSVVTRIDAHLTQKVKQEKAHLGLPEAAKDRVINDQVKFAELAKGYKTNPGPPTGHRRHRSERDDGDSGNEDDDEDPPDDHGPRSKWTVARLSAIDRQTLNKFPPPSRDGNGNNQAVDSEVQFNVAAAKYVEMGPCSDEEENGDDGVDGDDEEEGPVYLDVNHKRVLV